MRNIVIENAEDRFVEKRNFFINITAKKNFLLVEIVNCSFGSIRFFIALNFFLNIVMGSRFLN